MKRSRIWGLAAVGIVLAVGVAVALPRFLPERATMLDEPAPQGARTLLEGSWGGRAGHSASGHVYLVQNASQAWLRFEGFEMTNGPAVYLYLSMVEEPDSQSEIEGSWRLPLSGGADGGELTKRGDFNQMLPEGFDVSKVRGLGAWCDDFRVPFGVAAMAAP